MIWVYDDLFGGHHNKFSVFCCHFIRNLLQNHFNVLIMIDKTCQIYIENELFSVTYRYEMKDFHKSYFLNKMGKWID